MSVAAETNLWPLAAILPRVRAAEPGVEDDDRAAEALALGELWQSTLNDAVIDWQEQVCPEIYAAAVEQIEDAVKANDVEALATLTVPALGEALMLDAMRVMYAAGADFVVAEAADAGVKIKPAKASLSWQPMNSVGEVLTQWALALVLRIGSRTTAGLSNEALRLYRPGATVAQVTDGVQNYWDGLTDAVPRETIGAGLSRAVNLGKLDTYAAARPRGWRLELRADERLDKNTCVTPDTLITTGRGPVCADAVTLADVLLTHAGRWVAPSRIIPSDVDEDIVTLTLAGSRRLRVTADHRIMTANRGWVEAGELRLDDLLIDQPNAQGVGETVGLDFDFGQAPHGVAPGLKVSGLADVDVRAQRVPVTTVSLDDQPLAHLEVDYPRADQYLLLEGDRPAFEALSDDALDAGLKTAGHVAAGRAVAPNACTAGHVAEDDGAEFADNHDRWTSADLGAVASSRRLSVPEVGAAPAAYGGTATGVRTALARAVGVSTGVRCRDGERLRTVWADLRHAVALAADLGEQGGIGVLADLRAVDRLEASAVRDVDAADLARPDDVLPADAISGSVGAASSAPDDRRTAVQTRDVHGFSVLQIEAIEHTPYVGTVYDFTVPDDETFWANGVLVHNCGPCKDIDGTVLPTQDAANLAYGGAGYLFCKGRERCRGTVRSVWIVKAAKSDFDLGTLLSGMKELR